MTYGTFFFVSSKSGWLAGVPAENTFIHTFDGGKTACYQGLGTDTDVNAICFVDEKQGWIVGTKGTILHIDDGNACYSRYEPQNSSVNVDLASVYFLNSTEGWIVGSQGTILHTVDSGNTWKLQDCPVTDHLASVHFADSQNGWIILAGSLSKFVDQRSSSISVLRTENAGSSWVPQTTSLSDLISSIYSTSSQQVVTLRDNDGVGVSFVNAHQGWLNIGGGISVTTDSGHTWSEQLAYRSIPETNGFHRIQFIDPLHGWAMGRNYGALNTLVHTSDGGKNWRLLWSLGFYFNPQHSAEPSEKHLIMLV